jgi:flavorubredoxin
VRDTDYQNNIAVTREIHWIGFYDDTANFHCNPYLLIDEKDVVLFDPGSIPHFPIAMRKIIDLVNPSEISIIVAHHQDPDVCGNLAVVEDVINRTDLKIVAHENSIRLIRHYGLKSDFYPVEKHNFKLTLGSGRILDFIFTPYLHSPGAIMTYDSRSKTLFSSDVFGAVSDNWSLFAGENFLEPMGIFHREYMPSNSVLRNCMEKLEKLEIARILPQHGSVIEGDQVHTAINYLKNLPCGIDLEKG